MPKLRIFQPGEILTPGDAGGPDLSAFRHGFLAQGDSWFSAGAMPPFQTTNLLFELDLRSRAFAVNCASPGSRLRHMTDACSDPAFQRLLAGRLVPRRWDAILLSAGGNDMIDAAAVLPKQADGMPVPAHQRILLKPEEWTGAASVARYVSADGLARFEAHLAAQFDRLIALRDRESTNRGVPVFVHCYDYPLPRNAPVRFFAGKKTWLHPAVLAYRIPEADWFALSRYLITALKRMLQSLDLPQLFVVDTTGTLRPAAPDAEGNSMDWANEIHPNAAGYAKLAAKYAAALDRHFAAGLLPANPPQPVAAKLAPHDRKAQCSGRSCGESSSVYFLAEP